MPFTIQDLETRVVSAMARFGKEVGFIGATEGRLFGHLILAARPMTQDELMEKSGASRGNVSMALRSLMDAGFLNKVPVDGSRKDHYVAKPELWRITIGFVLARIGRQIESVTDEFSEILVEAKNLKKSGSSAAERRSASHLLDHVTKLHGYTQNAQTLISTVRRIVERNRNSD